MTDGTAASGVEDGEFRVGTQVSFKSGNAVRLADGTLAGSCLTMLEAFRNLVSIGLSVEEASQRTSRIFAFTASARSSSRIRGMSMFTGQTSAQAPQRLEANGSHGTSVMP